MGTIDNSRDSQNGLGDWFLSHSNYTFDLTYRWTQSSADWVPTEIPSFGLYTCPLGAPDRSRFTLGEDSKLVSVGPLRRGNPPDEIGVQLVPFFRRQLYVFQAERLKVGECSIGVSTALLPDASNLPSVLNLLQDNKVRFDDFNKTVRSILPQVPRVSVRPTAGNQNILEIRVWPFESSPDRADLVIPLKDSGTGLGQVLAIIYVVLTSRRPSVIVIDEPQSFLHPGAARRLIEVLKAHPQHQYIVTTHAPAVISVADPETVTIARLVSGETELSQLNTQDAKTQESLLAEVGARLSDVFGSDSVLWVEGLTEEICYRKIFRDLVRRPLLGAQILGVRHTGDLEGSGAERTIEIYNKITSSNSVIPPAIGFLFDSECLSEQQKKELTTKSKQLLHFLPRRMYENYLLDPTAIATVANTIENFRSDRVSPDEVTKLLQGILEDRSYYCGKVLPQGAADRTARVHGSTHY